MNLKDQNRIETTVEGKVSICNEITNDRSNILSYNYTEIYFKIKICCKRRKVDGLEFFMKSNNIDNLNSECIPSMINKNECL